MDNRINIAVIAVIILFGIFAIRLWHLQILRGHEYRQIDERNRLRVLNIPAPRGIIYDRNNKALVKNIPSFDIGILKEYIPKQPEILSELTRLIGLKPDYLRSRINKATTRPFRPVVLKQDVSFSEVAKVEARKSDFQGLQINVIGSREYVYGHSGSHLIGYLGSITTKQIDSPKYRDVPPEAFIGQFGVEKVYDEKLRGIAGKKIIEIDATGSIIQVARLNRPVKGKDIRLTIDINLQKEAEKSLKGKAGAIVAMIPDTGEILAMASAPSFDPNLFVRGINPRDWTRLLRDPQKPLLNRAIQSQYPPGSTFKIVTALAALDEGIINESTNYYCSGEIYFGRTFRCWKKEGHGNVNLHRAITESCDVYFYEIGKRLDIDLLARYAYGFGLGRPTGLEIEGEVAGLVPTSGWKLETKQERWFKGETLNTVIGQGYLSATPIQMASLISAVVNGGKLYKPYLLIDSEPQINMEKTVTIKPENIKLIKKALLGVVIDKDGTGWLARSDSVSISGKTGTTQVVGGILEGKDIPEKHRDHAWFVAYAPEDDPQIAVSVFIEHGGHGSTGAAPIAKRVIDTFFEGNQTLIKDRKKG
jgi:penicillin-binding protein 2